MNATKTPHTHKHRKTAHSALRAAAVRRVNHRRTQRRHGRLHAAREQQQQPKPKPGGGIEPPEGTSPGTFQNRAEVPGGQTDTKRPRETKSPVSSPNKTQSPSTQRRPEKTQTNEGDRYPDQTRPPDPQRRPTDPPESALTSNCRSISGLELAGAAEVGVCAGCDGGRDGSRPSPPPHGHARCSRRGRTRLRGRERPPAQLQVGARISNLRDIADFPKISLIFWLPEAHATSAPGASVRLRSYTKLRYSNFGICPCVLASLECKGMQQALRWPGERFFWVCHKDL